MSQDIDTSVLRDKVVDALELCAQPVNIHQLETLAGSRNLQCILDSLVSDGLVIVTSHSTMTTSGQAGEENRYQLGNCT